jgi:hypothetical protein
MTAKLTPGLLADVESARTFLLGGNATITLVSTGTGVRYTYRVKRAKGDKDNRPWFVGLLSGPDNSANYTFMGTIWPATKTTPPTFARGSSGKVSDNAPSMKAFRWFMGCLAYPNLPPSLEVWHEGRCGRCGRKLTVPESIASGIGPVCAGAA